MAVLTIGICLLLFISWQDMAKDKGIGEATQGMIAFVIFAAFLLFVAYTCFHMFAL